ncbi:hypothetical protein QQF64_035319 [Cirrhinus molitorella]|uniref:Microsomal glutathione S-transferase 1 n=1 Tax=Cirrhinus molitorella TaxID=172907 RepID=A0ABR3NFG2_9TELE
MCSSGKVAQPHISPWNDFKALTNTCNSQETSKRKFCKMADLMNNDVFLAFCTYATIVVLKMMFMAPLTGYFRMTRKAFSNWEDTALGKKNPEERKKMLQTNPDVERVRRCHQNDLENIVPFVPSRGLSWVVGMITTFSMAYRVLTTALLL